ncbi:tryptophan synthase subunit alpha [Desulfotalea psychrophila]|uniref:Tryptophan synthase alpha chain n=1 Tax=Desulfotalea psychrophila (strain LSv54 / DSM 12343) TaxID=177439 RepID=TRPA_DESPS|nr:tryptophan synthase subunit alpha [Desulfotalea psychrophila]Q6AMR6.1 RecName: Full=Tryptophan synthase alpha chain [Desulfotalea psychrophila LSv54]CAG36359.1 related to tryptophan synthase, alpha subunit [Desulfotalea psychrophila LSv54]
MTLEKILREKKKDKDILLMTHIVLGYPSFAANREVIEQMVKNGVDCIEMQIPFSEPMADGPVILKANQESLARGTRVAQCFDFAREMTRKHQIPFLFMTYYNIVFKYGEERFFQDAKEAGIKGLIVPDLPPEMGEDYFAYAEQYQLAPIIIYAPTSTPERMKTLAGSATGFIYCAARRGVTGNNSALDENFDNYLSNCRAATTLPLAVGFGIKSKADVQALIGKADMAVIGSQTIRLVDENGPKAVGPFVASLR